MVEVSAENITLVTVVTFLGVFTILTALMPPSFYASLQERREVAVPAYFQAIDVQQYYQTYVLNITSGQYIEYFTLGGWKLRFWSSFFVGYQTWIAIQRYDSWLVFEWIAEEGKWYNDRGILVSFIGSGFYLEHIDAKVLDDNYDVNRSLCKFTVKFEVTQFDIYFTFNASKYSKPSEAWQKSDLHTLIGVSLDKANTAFNAWNVVAQLLFFQLPNVHPLINMLIAIPIWVMIAWLIYILILKAIPFIGG